MNVVTRDLQQSTPWTLLYDDDVTMPRKAELTYRIKCRLVLIFHQRELPYEREECHGLEHSGRRPAAKNGCFQVPMSTSSSMTCDGGMVHDINHRITSGCSCREALPDYVLCDRNVSDKLVVRPVHLYGSGC